MRKEKKSGVRSANSIRKKYETLSLENKADYLTQLDKILAPNGFWLMYGFFKTKSHRAAPGLVDSALNLIATQALTLLTRKDGFDKRGRSSAWFLYQKK